MARIKSISTLVLFVVIASLTVVVTSVVSADPATTTAFDDAWSRLDRPVAAGQVSRSWFWGPDPASTTIEEQYEFGVSDTRNVQYFDKARMQSSADGGSVEAGDLVRELITGQIRISPELYTGRQPAALVVAGDPDVPDGITYAGLLEISGHSPFEEGAPVTTRLLSNGKTVVDSALASYNFVVGDLVESTNHRVASVFWEFLASSGTVWTGGEFLNEPLFARPLEGTGAPMTEAYWIDILLAGEPQTVLFQCFEIRCLTFTPNNPPGWQIEATNVGLHYYAWRYQSEDPPTPDQPDPDSALPAAEYLTVTGEAHTMSLEVAATSATRSCGLMHRDSMDSDTGMLFVFETAIEGSFWNCNTFIPLTLAWIDAAGTIIGFSEMEPQVRGEPQQIIRYPPPGPYRYVIEANAGWFEARGIQAGDRVDLAAAIAFGDTNSNTLCLELGLDCQDGT